METTTTSTEKNDALAAAGKHHEESLTTTGGDWILVSEGVLKGATLTVQRETDKTISLSTRSCREEDRWEEKIPDLSSYTAELQVLDLHKSRYLVEFDASSCPAPKLQRLLLTRCDNLSTIHPDIGSLQNLTEVRTVNRLLQCMVLCDSS